MAQQDDDPCDEQPIDWKWKVVADVSNYIAGTQKLFSAKHNAEIAKIESLTVVGTADLGNYDITKLGHI